MKTKQQQNIFRLEKSIGATLATFASREIHLPQACADIQRDLEKIKSESRKVGMLRASVIAAGFPPVNCTQRRLQDMISDDIANEASKL